MARKLLALLMAGALLMFAGCSQNQGGEETTDPMPEESKITVSIETADGMKFLKVSGLEDPAAEESINSELFTFSTWGLEESDMDGFKLEYAVVGDYLSVRRSGTKIEEGAAYPTNFFHTQIYDFSTGRQAGDLREFIKIEEDFRNLITSGAFKMIHPEGVEIEGAAEHLAAAIVDPFEYESFESRFYLTETGLGLYMEVLHAEGDYWIFEASYADIYPVMQKKLALALDMVPYEAP